MSERDKSLRAACLSTLAIIYDFEADNIWQLLGRLTDQQQSLIVERLKYREKELAKCGVTGGYRGDNAMDEPMNGADEPPQESTAPQQHFNASRHAFNPNSGGPFGGTQAGFAAAQGAYDRSQPSFIPGHGPPSNGSQVAFDERARRLKSLELTTEVQQDVDMGGQASPDQQPMAERMR